MRQMSDTERFMQIVTTEQQRDFYKAINTNPMPEWENVNDEWVPVHRIRYGGISDGPNWWGLR